MFEIPVFVIYNTIAKISETVLLGRSSKLVEPRESISESIFSKVSRIFFSLENCG